LAGGVIWGFFYIKSKKHLTFAPRPIFVRYHTMSVKTPLKIFIVYAREDAEALTELRIQLEPVKRSEGLSVWYDGEILPGEHWEQSIKDALDAADIVLLFISKHFFASEYIQTTELKRALERHAAGEAAVVPVIVRTCMWHIVPELKYLQALPDQGHPIYSNKWHDTDSATTNVVEGILKMAQQRRALKAPSARPPQQENIVPPPPPAKKETAPDMVLVKGGGFQMGSNDYDHEKPIHTVRVADFYMGRYPVTLAEFRAFIKATGHATDAEKEGHSNIWTGETWEQKNGINWRHNVQGQPATDTHPVIHVSWNDAVAYCAWLNEVLPAGHKAYRLPTEAEWEYAARGGEHRDEYRYAGSDNIDEVAWYRGNSNMATHPVGQKKSNALGLHDMSGLAWEWCSDWYGADYYKNSPTDNPKGPAFGSYRVLRGGAWDDNPQYARVAHRDYDRPDGRSYITGFRLARAK
jgi:formylglycine-generating enzyme